MFHAAALSHKNNNEYSYEKKKEGCMSIDFLLFDDDEHTPLRQDDPDDEIHHVLSPFHTKIKNKEISSNMSTKIERDENMSTKIERDER